ncbi:RICIN domain-containing protein [Streptomyces sp. NPDC014894]|uniref:RICIN domain-containing protein n=1 Tax=unclassified Streptomyces TaxID=2593676 RepID=UPI0036FEC3AC
MNGAFRPGRHLVRNVGSGLLLEVYGGARGSGAVVQLAAETGAAAQQWLIEPVPGGSGLHHFVNAASGKRLDVTGASTENGARIQQWRANNFGAQEWIIESHVDAPGTVAVVSFVSGLLLEAEDGGADGGGTGPGARVRQWEDTDSPAQQWRLEPCAADPA